MYERIVAFLKLQWERLYEWLFGRNEPEPEQAAPVEEPEEDPIGSQYVEYMGRVLHALLPLADKLIGVDGEPPKTLSELVLDGEPIRLEIFNAKWRERFDKGGSQRGAIVKLQRSILEDLLAVRGGWLGPSAYAAVEQWWRDRVPLAPDARPRVTLGLVWFVAAVHNWLWWLQPQVRGKNRKRGGPTWHEGMNESVDHMLCEMGDLESGDWIAMHLIVLRLRELVPAGLEPLAMEA